MEQIMVKKLLYTLLDGEILGRPLDIEFYGTPIGLDLVNQSCSYVRINKEKQVCMVENCLKGEFYDSVQRIGFSNDGSKLVYVAKLGKKEFLIVNQKPMKEYDKILEYTFSKKGKIAFVARQGKKFFAVEEGKEDPSYEFVYEISYNDNEELEYFANKGGVLDKRIQFGIPETTGQWYTVRNHQPEEVKYKEREKTPSSWNYSAVNVPNMSEMVEGEDRIRISEMESIILGHKVKIEKKGKNVFIVIDGIKDEEPYNKIDLVYFSKKNKKIKFLVIKDKSSYIVEKDI
jgi:hypothetical protein